MTLIINPFYLAINGGTAQDILYKKVFEFERALILSPNFESKVCFSLVKYIFEEYIACKEITMFNLLECNINIMLDKTIKRNSNIVSGEILSKLFPNRAQFDDQEIVVIMLDKTKQECEYYSQVKYRHNNINKIKYAVAFNNNRESLIRELELFLGTPYFEKKKNCCINLTDKFNARMFPRSFKINNNYAEPDGKFLDIYDSLNAGGTRTYYINNHNPKNDEVLRKMILSIDNEFTLYNVICRLLLSKDYCHLVVNDVEVLVKTKQIINKHKRLFRYLWGYGWLCMYIEECIMKSKTREIDRYVMDTDTVAQMPTFPVCSKFLYANPYVTALIGTGNVYNAMAIEGTKTDQYYGIVDTKTFEQRMRVFITGKNVDPFANLEWENLAISGSIIAACLRKNSPLCNSLQVRPDKHDEILAEFYNKYYKDSDVDIMYKTDKLSNLIRKVLEIRDCINNNTKGLTTIESKKNVLVCVSDIYINRILDKINILYNTQYTSETINQMKVIPVEIRSHIYNTLYLPHSAKFKTKLQEEIGKEKFCIEDFESPVNFGEVKFKIEQQIISENKINVYNHNEEINSNGNTTLKIVEGIRFRIKDSTFVRPLEIFSVERDFLSVISKFHLPCVRAYYNRDKNKGTIKLLPSCVSAMMTGINIDYKYFSGTQKCVNIINKYENRGYGTILNLQEMKHKYINEKESKAKTFKEYCTGCYINREKENCLTISPLMFIRTQQDLEMEYCNAMYYKNKKIAIDDFTTINRDGKINSVKSWLINGWIS